MELGQITVYFVQYKGTYERWFTQSTAYAGLTAAQIAAENLHEINGYETRIVKQTTTNSVI